MAEENESEEEYYQQIAKMTELIRGWMKKNRGKEALITFPVPPAIICGLTDAIESHLITTNAAGMELILHACPNLGEHNEPTLMMLRAALDAAQPKEETHDTRQT